MKTKIFVSMMLLIFVAYASADTEVYMSPLNMSSGEDVMHIMVNTSGNVTGVNTFIVYDPYCITITDIRVDDPDWWLPTRPTYAEGKVLFSVMRWGNSTGNFNVVNMTVCCVACDGCDSVMNFSDDCNPFYQDVFGTRLGNISWTNSSVLCTACTEVCGDVNCDGVVTISDVLDAYYRVINPNYQICSEWAADVTGDGIISISDVLDIYYKVINPAYELCCIAE